MQQNTSERLRSCCPDALKMVRRPASDPPVMRRSRTLSGKESSKDSPLLRRSLSTLRPASYDLKNCSAEIIASLVMCGFLSLKGLGLKWSIFPLALIEPHVEIIERGKALYQEADYNANSPHAQICLQQGVADDFRLVWQRKHGSPNWPVWVMLIIYWVFVWYFVPFKFKTAQMTFYFAGVLFAGYFVL